MSLNDPKPKKERKTLGKALRRQKVIEYAAQGLTNDAIAKKLGVDEKTIDRDMKSVQIQDYIHDLVKRQVQDIEASKPLVRLQFRGDLLDKLLPRKPAVDLAVNVNQTQVSHAPVIDFSKLTEDERKALLRAEETLARNETAVSS